MDVRRVSARQIIEEYACAEGARLAPLVAHSIGGACRPSARGARVVTTACTMLALVTDAFGGRGGIAQYNRDLLGAIAETNLVSMITILPRQTLEPPQLPRG